MKNSLAFSTLGCPKWPFEKILAEAVRMGFGAVEIRGVGNCLRTDALPCFFPENREATIALFRRYGVHLCVAGTSVSFHDPGHTAEALEEGRKAIDVCRRIGIPAIRVFGDRWLGDRKETLAQVIDGLGTLCRYAEAGGGVRVLLEVHGDFNTTEALEGILLSMESHPSFGIIWDVEHSYRAYGANVVLFYERIRPWICHVHIKDCVMRDGEALPCLPGQGEIDLAALVGRLRADGYEGYYSFEWEKRWHPEIEEPETAFPRYVRLMKEWLGAE